VEGDVGRVGCPDPECVKANREAIEEEVTRVVGEEDVKRWRWLREKRALEKGSFAKYSSYAIRVDFHRPIARALSAFILSKGHPETLLSRGKRRI
jgi:hypothetical protein